MSKPSKTERPFQIIFEGKRCIGTGKCAEVSENWTMNFRTGLGQPKEYFITRDQLDANIRAALACPAKKGKGVIHIVDRNSDNEICPDPFDNGTLSLG